MKISDILLSLLFPRFCLGCHKRGKYFCSSCQKKIILSQKTICPVCEKPAFLGETHPKCKTLYSLDGLTSIFAYKGIIKKAIWEIKYRFIFDICQSLVNLVTSSCFSQNKHEREGHKIFEASLSPGGHRDGLTPKKFSWPTSVHATLVPVSLFWTRKLWRGFNQSEVLGYLLAQKLGLSFVSVLHRAKKTLPQVHLEEKRRKENIKGAFVVKKGVRISKKVILFDDVWTTGATMREAAKVLKKAGAKFVWGLTIAS